jgi:hypothetical protein
MALRIRKSAAACAFALMLSSLVVLSCGAGPDAESSDANSAPAANGSAAATEAGGEASATTAPTNGGDPGSTGSGSRFAGTGDRPPAPDPRKAGNALYWGATIGEHLTGEQAPWDMNAVAKFERKVGKRLSLIGFYIPFADCTGGSCEPYAFPTTPLDNVRNHGAIPFLSWSSDSSPSRLSQPRFQLRDVAAGRHDRLIRSWAIKARNWGHPFFLRFNWEMNGFWFPWGAGVNGNDNPADYIRAWRRTHRIFDRVGATNATWVWCPNVDFTRKLQNLKSLYPGNRWVDWTCLDGFNWGKRPDSAGWQSFDEVFRSTYKRVVKLAPRKPMVIGEVASNTVGGNKGAWIRNMFRRLSNGYSKVRAFLWFDVVDRNTHWPIETSRSATRAFRRGIARRIYRPNLYGGLSASPIRPPK